MWSPTDFAEAHWLGCAYVITSTDGVPGTDGAKAVLTNAWVLSGTSEEDKKFETIEVEQRP
jgi:hypothetical protein